MLRQQRLSQRTGIPLNTHSQIFSAACAYLKLTWSTSSALHRIAVSPYCSQSGKYRPISTIPLRPPLEKQSRVGRANLLCEGDSDSRRANRVRACSRCLQPEVVQGGLGQLAGLFRLLHGVHELRHCLSERLGRPGMSQGPSVRRSKLVVQVSPPTSDREAMSPVTTDARCSETRRFSNGLPNKPRAASPQACVLNPHHRVAS